MRFKFIHILILQIQQMQEEARQQMLEDLERRKEVARQRRNENLANRLQIESLTIDQEGRTRPFVFSYCAPWTRSVSASSK